MMSDNLYKSELGKKSAYEMQYNPSLLFAIPRLPKRSEIGINDMVFYGFDLWNHYEISWLNMKGKPMVAIGEIAYPASSSNIIESKSMKLYFNSLNGTKISSHNEVVAIVTHDLSKAVGAKVHFRLLALENELLVTNMPGTCLDNLDIECSVYEPSPHFLTCEHFITQERLYTNLLKSNCLVTGQPDWGTLSINYSGAKINHNGLLKYIVSLRNHNEFHEQCVERIFYDIKTFCNPQQLTVYARYTRRGGLDINPYRTTDKDFTIINPRLIRQ